MKFYLTFIVFYFSLITFANTNKNSNNDPLNSPNSLQTKRNILIFPFLFKFGEWHTKWDMHYGSEGIYSIHSALQKVEDNFIPTSVFSQKDNIFHHGVNIVYRLVKTFFIDYPINFMLPTFQHEYFGHGSRYKHRGHYIGEVGVGFPPPFQFIFFAGVEYSHAHGTLHVEENKKGYYTYTNESGKSFKLGTYQEFIYSTIAGSEANNLLAEVIRRNVLLNDTFDYRTSLLYLYSNNDLNGYAAFASGFSDIDFYSELIELNYPDKLNQKQVKEKLFIYGIMSILADPLNYFSYYNVFKNYFIDGKKQMKIVWVPFFYEMHYLPKIRFGLTPFGMEIFIQNYFKHRQSLYNVTVAFSDGAISSSWRIILKAWELKITKNLFVNLETQLWQQPAISYLDINNREKIAKIDAGIGGVFLVSLLRDKIIADSIGAFLQLGYKSNGFMEGELLQNSFMSRMGMSLKF